MPVHPVHPVVAALASASASAPSPTPSPSLTPDLGADKPDVGQDISGVGDVALFAATIGLAALGAWLLAVVAGVVLRRAGRRSPLVQSLSHRTRRPFRALLVVIAVRVAMDVSGATNDWVVGVNLVLGVAVVGAAAWLAVGAAATAEDEVVRRYRVDVVDNRHARRVRTQTSFVRRLVVAAIVVVAVGVVLLAVIPGASQFGAVLLSSAGLLSVVAGLAAQTALGNVFAGLQIAFTDALRVEDVVVVESQFGRVEEITLTYVVVRLWDERRMVLPSTFFTTTPFENWTRRDSALLGTVIVEADWRADVDGLREELHRVLSEDDLWDGRVGVLQVTDAVGSVVQLRALVSGADAGAVFDLRCHVREALVGWLVDHPAGLPHLRQLNSDESAAPARPRAVRGRGPTGWELPGEVPSASADGAGAAAPANGAGAAGRAAGTGAGTGVDGAGDAVDTGSGRRVGSRGDSLFTGSPEAEERSRQFAGPRDDDRGPVERVDAPGGRDEVGSGATVATPAREGGEPDAGPADDAQPPTVAVPAVPPRRVPPTAPTGAVPHREAHGDRER